MSLINKMLQDLESRKDTQTQTAITKPAYDGLKPLARVTAPRASLRLPLMLVAVVAVAGAGVYAWTQWGQNFLSRLNTDEVAAKPSPPVARKASPKPAPVATAPQTVAVATQTATALEVTAPSVSLVEKPAEPQVIVAPVPVAPTVVTEQKKSEPVQQVTAPKPAATPASSKARKAAEAGYWTVARGETLYGISTQTGVDLWDLSRWNKLGREHVIQSGQRLRLTPPAQAETRPVKAAPPAMPAKEKTAVAAAGEITSGNAVMDKKLKPLSSGDKAEAEYRRALDLLQKGRADDAGKQLRLALNADATHTPARELLAGLMLQQGHWREAQQVLEQGIEKVPAHYPFAQLLARVHVEHGADQKALDVMEQNRRAGADNAEYVAFQAALYQRVGRHAEAVKAYGEAIKLNPQEGRSWLGLGISLEATQDWNAAGDAYQHAINSGSLDDNLLRYARQRLAVLKK